MTQQHGRPIAIFWYNLAVHGAEFSISDDGQLKVKLSGTPLESNPYVKEEIGKRASLLVKLLDKRGVAPLLAQYIGEPLTAEEARTAALLAKRYSYRADVYEASGRYIVGNVQKVKRESTGAALDAYGRQNGCKVNLSEVLA